MLNHLRYDFRIAATVLCFFLLLLIFPGRSSAKDVILWVNDNMPPAFIMEGSDKGDGIVDGVVSIYKENMPEYEHRHLSANMARILAMMKEGQKVIYAGFLKTAEREKYIYFSIPNLINFSNSVIVKKGRFKSLFGSSTRISLETLLQNNTLKLGLTKDRAYGGILDDLFEKYRGKNSAILYRAGQNSLQGLLQMLDAGRIDYTIGFPWEIPYVAGQIGKRQNFSVIAIEEGMKHYWIKNYIVCPNNEWGRQVIQKINRILLKVRPTEKHMYHQLKWFPENMEPMIRKAYKEHILTAIE